MAKSTPTDYLIVKISELTNKKNMGLKCIPASWIQNTLAHNYLITRYPSEETLDTKLQVQNKQPASKEWPSYCATIMFRTDSYEKAIEFMTDKYKKDQLITATEKSDKNIIMNEKNITTDAIPSTSGKHKQLEENENNLRNEDNLPKKLRTSYVRLEKIQKLKKKNQMNKSDKLNNSSKKVLSLRKGRIRTPNTLIRTGRFKTLDKFYSALKSPAKSQESKENDDKNSTDDSDSDSEPSPDRNTLEPISKNEPNSINSTKIPRRKKTPMHVTMDIGATTSANNLEMPKELEMNSDVYTRQSLNTGVSILENLLTIPNFPPTNATETKKTLDIKHIKNIYNTILDVKGKLNAVFLESSLILKKSFEPINLSVPELNTNLAASMTQNSQPKTTKNISRTKTNITRTKTNNPRTKTNITRTKINIPRTKINISKSKTNNSRTKTNISRTKTNIPRTKTNNSKTKTFRTEATSQLPKL